MKVFICKSHNGVWLPGCSVVVAENEEHAWELLFQSLSENEDTYDDDFKLEEIDTTTPNAYILFNGDY